MTTTAVKEFLNKVGEDEALQAELAKALEAENDRQAVTDLAKSKGYDFTPEELWEEVQKRQEEVGELSDEELEAVAGGGFAEIATAAGTIALSQATFGLIVSEEEAFKAQTVLQKEIKW